MSAVTSALAVSGHPPKPHLTLRSSSGSCDVRGNAPRLIAREQALSPITYALGCADVIADNFGDDDGGVFNQDCPPSE
jgi:hypothetical protein